MSSRYRVGWLSLFLLGTLPVVVPAQSSRAPDLEIGVASWTLDLGTASSEATLITVMSAALGWQYSRMSSVHIKAGKASEGNIEPGVFSLQLGYRLETARAQGALGAFTALTVGLLDWDADNNERVRNECTGTCFFEGVAYETGQEYAAALLVGARIPLMTKVTLEPYVEGSLPFGRKTGGRMGEGTRTLRFGCALAWRP